ncbi:MAG: AraC family transcriptional regulator ligand-binding domain-containing protein [Rubrivivax sp.]
MTRPDRDVRPTIPIGQVDQLLLGARQRGLDPAPLLARAGIAPALLAAPLAQVTQAQYAALARLLARRLRDELWGLCPHALPPGSFAQGLQLMVRCATLGEAMALALRHYRLLLVDLRPRLRLQGELATVAFTPQGAAPDAAMEYALRALAFIGHGTLCWLAGRRVPLHAANVPHQRLALAHAQRLFGAPVTQEPGWTGWRLDRAWLALPVVQTPAGAALLLRQAPAGLLLRYRDESGTVAQVRRILRRHLGGEAPTLEQVAAELGQAPQTLRRHLARDGEPGFRALRDALRRDAAIEYLARPQLTLAEIAQRLGFSEVSTFHRAFRHWTGVAPGQYRLTRQQRPGG